MPWSTKHEQCVSCGTARRPHKGRGLCSRCYALTRKLEQVQQWDTSDPKTLKGCPLPGAHADPKRVARFKASFAKQLREQLDSLRQRELKLAGPIDGLDLELMLERVAALARGPRAGLYNGLATLLQSALDDDQRHLIYELLFRVVDCQPMPQLSIERAFEESRK